MSTQSKALKVVAVRTTEKDGTTPLADKNGNPFKVLTVEPADSFEIQYPGTRMERIVAVPVKPTGGIVLFKKSYLPSNNGKPDFGYDAEVGDYLRGDIVTRNVEEYEITDGASGEVRKVNRVTVAVFADTNDKVAFTRALASRIKSKQLTVTDWTPEEEAILNATAAPVPAPVLEQNENEPRA
jgi:hypothetical protein